MRMAARLNRFNATRIFATIAHLSVASMDNDCGYYQQLSWGNTPALGHALQDLESGFEDIVDERQVSGCHALPLRRGKF
jgi:hypothetical protein